jgi:superfamily I DNA/RNA helicase
LQAHREAAGLQRGFRIADEGERAAAFAEALGVSVRKAGRTLAAISKAKRMHRPLVGVLGEPAAAYRRMMELRNWIDLDDLVGLAIQALESDPALTARWRDRFRWISVDEFQDVDEQQYRLIRLLAPPPRASLCVIGDPDQAIYGFRGADPACFRRFAQHYPATAVVALRRNYRSTGTIVAAAAQVIAGPDGEPALAEAAREMQERIAIHAAASDRAEAEFVVQSIEQAIGGLSLHSIDSGRAAGGASALSFADIAVLYRTTAQAAPLAEALARAGIPSRQHGHAPLLDRPAVRAIAAVLEEQLSEQALPDRLRAAARRLASSGASEGGADVEPALLKLLALARGCDDDPQRFAEALPLATDADTWDARADAVSLMTLHAAKGLEFPVVFLVGLEDGLMPLRWSRRSEEDAEEDGAADLAEERRLLYVGMTRARDRLYLSRAERRPWRHATPAPPRPPAGPHRPPRCWAAAA